jgi:regulator of nonsense transcripts 1
MQFSISGTKCQAQGHLIAIDHNQITASMKFKTGEVPESTWDSTLPCSIHFLPPDSVFRRQALGLQKLKERPATDIIRQTILGQRQPPVRTQKVVLANSSDESSKKAFQATPTQIEAIGRALSRPFTLVQGPPGTGKTRMIAEIVVNLLRLQPRSKILVCATSNTAVQNDVVALFRPVEALRKKLLWLGSANRDVEWSEKLSPEFRTLAYIQMMSDSSPEGVRFAELRRRQHLRGGEAIEAFILRQQLEEALCGQADVVCCTLETAARDCLTGQTFPTVIMDEATQALEPSALIPLIYGAERVVLVGDQCQLGPVVCNQNLEANGYGQSLFERLIKANVDSIMLDRQFRMHPEISAFPNAQFYNGRIQDGVTAKERLHRIRECFPNPEIPLSFIDHNGDELQIKNSYGNSLEAEIVVRVVCRLLKAGIPPSHIGIITPYRGQVKLIDKDLRHEPSDYPGLKIATVDSFQGNECDYIIMSTVRSGGTIGFVKDTRRMNVSLTRARYGLVIVGHRETLSYGSDDWYALCEHFEAKGVLTKEGIRSNAALAALMKLGKR